MCCFPPIDQSVAPMGKQEDFEAMREEHLAPIIEAPRVFRIRFREMVVLKDVIVLTEIEVCEDN